MSRMSSVPSDDDQGPERVHRSVPRGRRCRLTTRCARNARRAIVRRSSFAVRRMTYDRVRSAPSRRTEAERGAAPETLGRGPVAQDQARDRRHSAPAPSSSSATNGPTASPIVTTHAGIREQVPRPGRLRAAGGDEQRAVGRPRRSRPRRGPARPVRRPRVCDDRDRPPRRRAARRSRRSRAVGVSGSAATTCPRSGPTARRPARRAACRAIVRAPSAAIDWRSAPTRFSEPSVTCAGPNRIRSSGPTVPTLIRVPRGSVGEGAAMPQFVPRPGASAARASGEPEHQRVRAGRDRLGQLAAATHPAVGDDRHVAAGLGEDTRRGPPRRR